MLDPTVLAVDIFWTSSSRAVNGWLSRLLKLSQCYGWGMCNESFTFCRYFSKEIVSQWKEKALKVLYAGLANCLLASSFFVMLHIANKLGAAYHQVCPPLASLSQKIFVIDTFNRVFSHWKWIRECLVSPSARLGGVVCPTTQLRYMSWK